MHKIALLAGDGIGPEVIDAARRVLDATGFDAEYTEAPVGWAEWCNHGEALPDASLQACHAADAVLFGAITSKPAADAERELASHLQGTGLRYSSPIVQLRQRLELNINVRPNAFWPGVPSPLAHPPVAHNDIPFTTTIFRENTEDLYLGLEAGPEDTDTLTALGKTWPLVAQYTHERGPRVAATLRLNTEQATRRVVTAAFDHAEANGHETVVLAEKPNVMRATGGLVQTVAREVAAGRQARLVEMNADALACEMVRAPERFPIIVATNLFGDLLSDLAAGLTGGLGLAPSANIGTRHALFEPVHGSAPDIAGRGTANPLATILAAAMMLDHLGETDRAQRIRLAVMHLLAAGAHTTPDLGGNATTAESTAAVIAALDQEATTRPALMT